MATSKLGKRLADGKTIIAVNRKDAGSNPT